jgi:hypothetical protein
MKLAAYTDKTKFVVVDGNTYVNFTIMMISLA